MWDHEMREKEDGQLLAVAEVEGPRQQPPQ